MYNKLFTKILDSSIWLAPDPHRLVWITLIAAMDEDGNAMFACADNLAARARVSVKQAEDAIKAFEAPDRKSGDPDNEGRRIERFPGGWHVLNAHKYRALVTKEIIREQTRVRTAKWREHKAVTQCDATVTARDETVTPSEALSGSISKSGSEKSISVAPLPKQAYANEFEIFKTIYPKRSGSQPWNKAYKALSARLADGVVWGEIEAGALRYAQWCRETGKVGTEFVMQAVRFLGPEQQFLLAWDLPTTKAEARLDGNLDARERAKQELFGER